MAIGEKFLSKEEFEAWLRNLERRLTSLGSRGSFGSGGGGISPHNHVKSDITDFIHASSHHVGGNDQLSFSSIAGFSDYLDQAVKQASTPTFATVKLNNLSTGYIPYHASNGLIDSGLKWDSSNNRLGLGVSSPGHFLDARLTNQNQSSIATIYASNEPATLISQTTSGIDEALDYSYEAFKFNTGNNTAVGSVILRIKKDAGVSDYAYVWAALYTNNNGVPGTRIAGYGSYFWAVQYAQSIGTSYSEKEFFIRHDSLSPNTDYWIIIYRSASGFYIDRTTGGSDNYAYSSDGSSWTLESDKRPYFKLRGRTHSGVYSYSANSAGVYSDSTNSYGIYGVSTNFIGVRGDSTNYYGIYGYSVNFIGVRGDSTNSAGVYGVSINSSAVFGVSTNSVGVRGDSTNSFAGFFAINPSDTNNLAEVLRIYRNSSGTPADGIGGSLNWHIKDSAGHDELSGRIGVQLTNATSGQETSAMSFWTRNNGGALTERLRIDGAGNLLVGTQSGSNIITVVQNSETDPIADSWTTYASDREQKEILGGISADIVSKFVNIPTYIYRRKARVSRDEVLERLSIEAPEIEIPKDEAVEKAMGEEEKQTENLKPGVRYDEKTGKYYKKKEDFTEEEIAQKQIELLAVKEALPKYQLSRVGIMIDDPEIPEEIIAIDGNGNVGLDLLGMMGYLWAVVKEIAKRLPNS